MLVLHGAWIPEYGKRAPRFAVWGERTTWRSPSAPARRRTGQPKRAARAHPFGATAAQLREPLRVAWPDSEQVAHVETVLARLPSSGGVPLASPDAAAWSEGEGDEPEGAPGLAAWRIDALTFEAPDAVDLLLALAADSTDGQLGLGDDLGFWSAASRFALELLARQRFMPGLQQRDEAYEARWRPVLDQERDARRFKTLAGAMPAACRALAWEEAATEPGPRRLLDEYLAAVVDGVARRARPFAALRRGPGRPTPVEAWLEALSADGIVHGHSAELAIFGAQYRAWAEPADALAGGDTFRLCLRLDPPPAALDGGVVVPDPDARDWRLEYLLQATDEPSLLLPVEEVWRQRGATARLVSRRLEHPQERVLAGLGRASRLYSPIEASLRDARPRESRLTAAEAHEFVREKALLLQASGFGVLVPGLESKLGVRVRLGRSGSSPGGGSGPSLLSKDTLVAYDWQLALGDQPLSREEFEALARLKAPLVQVRGQWVELRPEQLEQALAMFRRQGSGEMSLQDAMRLALAPDGEHGLPVVEVAAEGWMAELLRQVGEGGRREPAEEPPGFLGRLRPYQKLGVGWLKALCRFGLGACLADDMGLGKTVQLIALLLDQRASERERAPGPTLLVCPTSVVGNWRREVERFAPGLRVLVHHGAGRSRESFAEEAAHQDVVISTYALLHRDEQELARVQWSSVVLDEAQNIKNPSTKAAQVARRLPAHWRAALTGTPVENRLSDLWSIFQFLNPGYLGPGEEFRRRFAIPIERARDAAAAERLRKLVGPFILRRVKADRDIIRDLPEKNEMKVYCTLTREQATLYEAVVRESLAQIEDAEGVQRRGQVLATLTKLKQVCNHPALFLHDHSQLAGRSGKLERLAEMLEEVLSVDDRALVFTQYAQMGRLLKQHLEATFSREVLFLHGGTPAAERDHMVARFQAERRGPRVFVLSLKAGGTGLNLTQANHVFHFDRWWNPAVENQATDRAFRIGQRRDVQVHKFLCVGTFEEAIDQLIERKLELSQAIVGTGETWITELSTDELRTLFALRSEAVAA